MSYLRFADAKPVPGVVPAGAVAVLSARRGDVLGLIVHHGRWRQYVFEAAPDTIWSHDCLSDVAAKLRELNAAKATQVAQVRGALSA